LNYINGFLTARFAQDAKNASAHPQIRLHVQGPLPEVPVGQPPFIFNCQALHCQALFHNSGSVTDPFAIHKQSFVEQHAQNHKPEQGQQDNFSAFFYYGIPQECFEKRELFVKFTEGQLVIRLFYPFDNRNAIVSMVSKLEL